MDVLFKLCGAALVGVVLLVILEKHEKHMAVLLGVAVCCMIAVCSLEFLRPVVSLVQRLQDTANMDPALLGAVLKAAGTAMVCEITAMVCTEAGYGSLGKSMQLAGVFLILYFSLPLFHALLDLVGELLGGL